jgi:hypothetical protein
MRILVSLIHLSVFILILSEQRITLTMASAPELEVIYFDGKYVDPDIRSIENCTRRYANNYPRLAFSFVPAHVCSVCRLVID